MRMHRWLKCFGFAKLAVVLGAAGFLATSSNAQSRFLGQLALPCETNWSGHILPAGEYTINVPGPYDTPYIVLRAVHGNTVAVVSSYKTNEKSGEGNRIVLTAAGNRCVVRSLSLASLGMEIVYKPLTKQERAALKSGGAGEMVALAVKKL
jgi:hypothetical protein